jgi:hypothetical protein
MLYRVARWLLTRLLFVLLVALAVVVFARQFSDGSSDGDIAEPSSEVTRPSIEDHWHVAYKVYICGQRQPDFAIWQGGIHTHDDGIIHIHPFLPSEEGEGARLVKWFEYGGGKLTQSEMRMPGSREEYKNGDECPDGSEAVLQVFLNGERLEDWSGYIPQDGDRVQIEFGEEAAD